MNHEKQPIARYIILAVVVLIAGIGGFIYWIITGISGLHDELTQITAPGEHRISLEKVGTYTVFWEYSGAQGAFFPGNIDMKVISDQDRSIPVHAAGVNQTYSFNGRHGVALLQFDIESPGDYLVVTHIKGHETEGPVTLTLACGFMTYLFHIILGGLAMVFGSIILAVLLVVYAVIGRRKTRPVPPPGMAPPIE